MATAVTAVAAAALGVVALPRLGVAHSGAVAGADGSAVNQNILLAGFDEFGLTDSIMLAHLGADGSASVVSLPRDSWVTVPGHGMAKLNSVYRRAREDALAQGRDETAAAQAGTGKLIETVRDLTGVGVDHYALVDMAGFDRLSTAVGGVAVCERTVVVDPGSGQVVSGGRQELSGPAALEFLRQRRDLPRGDLDRIARLQAFTGALVRKLVTGTVLTDEQSRTALLTAVRDSVRVDPGWDLIGFAEQVRGLRVDSLRMATIPVGDQSLVVPDGGHAVEVVPDQVRSFVQAFTTGTGSTAGTGNTAGTSGTADPGGSTPSGGNTAPGNTAPGDTAAPGTTEYVPCAN